MTSNDVGKTPIRVREAGLLMHLPTAQLVRRDALKYDSACLQICATSDGQQVQ